VLARAWAISVGDGSAVAVGDIVVAVAVGVLVAVGSTVVAVAVSVLVAVGVVASATPARGTGVALSV
jgi:hypothetical protein